MKKAKRSKKLKKEFNKDFKNLSKSFSKRSLLLMLDSVSYMYYLKKKMQEAPSKKLEEQYKDSKQYLKSVISEQKLKIDDLDLTLVNEKLYELSLFLKKFIDLNNIEQNYLLDYLKKKTRKNSLIYSTIISLLIGINIAILFRSTTFYIQDYKAKKQREEQARKKAEQFAKYSKFLFGKKPKNEKVITETYTILRAPAPTEKLPIEMQREFYQKKQTRPKKIKPKAKKRTPVKKTKPKAKKQTRPKKIKPKPKKQTQESKELVYLTIKDSLYFKYHGDFDKRAALSVKRLFSREYPDSILTFIPSLRHPKYGAIKLSAKCSFVIEDNFFKIIFNVKVPKDLDYLKHIQPIFGEYLRQAYYERYLGVPRKKDYANFGPVFTKSQFNQKVKELEQMFTKAGIMGKIKLIRKKERVAGFDKKIDYIHGFRIILYEKNPVLRRLAFDTIEEYIYSSEFAKIHNQ